MKIISSLFLMFIVGCSSQKVLQNHVSYQVDEDLLRNIQTKGSWSRTPASAVDVEKLSAKRVYFKTLFEQYLTFSELSQTTKKIDHCPAFHSDFLEARPLEGVISQRRSDHIIASMEQELVELCDRGVSANYYRFENLVNYHVHKRSFHQDPTSIFSLLKIPVFQNMYEFKTSHGLVVRHPQLMELTRTYWFSSYLDQYKVNETALVRR
ncbi:MAG TPA: hypothetical protein VKZ84_05650 [Bacteriovoracaceae bacterium]|nr:hypothetical protein [Bacteriovoracaceae bacterium]